MDFADYQCLAFSRQGRVLTIALDRPLQRNAITGPIKDLINRGGEKISAKEVEEILHEHPGALQAAVVAMPRERLGETVCAYLVARQKIPERIVVVDDFPKTPSGKVRKDLLRADVRDLLNQET